MNELPRPAAVTHTCPAQEHDWCHLCEDLSEPRLFCAIHMDVLLDSRSHPLAGDSVTVTWLLTWLVPPAMVWAIEMSQGLIPDAGDGLCLLLLSPWRLREPQVIPAGFVCTEGVGRAREVSLLEKVVQLWGCLREICLTHQDNQD